MRSAVVFPEPDGPTRTMNSPSLMCRSSPLTAGTSEPGYTRVAASKRTSAIVPPCCCEFAAYTRLCIRARTELVERGERGAEHGRRLGGVELDVRTELVQLRLDQLEHAAVHVAREPSAERDLHVLLRQAEPRQRR